MIDFGIWQGRLSPVIRDAHRHQAGVRRMLHFNPRESVRMLTASPPPIVEVKPKPDRR